MGTACRQDDSYVQREHGRIADPVGRTQNDTREVEFHMAVVVEEPTTAKVSKYIGRHKAENGQRERTVLPQ